MVETIFDCLVRIGLEGVEVGIQERVTGLRGQFSRRHAEVRADDGIKSERVRIAIDPSVNGNLRVCCFHVLLLCLAFGSLLKAAFLFLRLLRLFAAISVW